MGKEREKVLESREPSHAAIGPQVRSLVGLYSDTSEAQVEPIPRIGRSKLMREGTDNACEETCPNSGTCEDSVESVPPRQKRTAKSSKQGILVCTDIRTCEDSVESIPPQAEAS